jgi:hypothetical protein
MLSATVRGDLEGFEGPDGHLLGGERKPQEKYRRRGADGRLLDWRRSRKHFVTLQGESGPDQKVIGELSSSERKSLAAALRKHVADQLLERPR